jgi:hypothetical protein
LIPFFKKKFFTNFPQKTCNIAISASLAALRARTAGGDREALFTASPSVVL